MSSETTHLIAPTTSATGEVQFQLPFDASLIASFEAVDLDLMVVSTTGDKYILQQGALQAAVNPESKLLFNNGDALSAADQFKRIGILKPVEGGSFRLASASLPDMPEKINGSEFGLGQDAQDTAVKIEKILKALEAVTQSNNAETHHTTTANGGTKVSSREAVADPLASPSPGAPPVPEEIKNTNTSDVKVNSTPRTFTGNSVETISGVLVSAVGNNNFTPSKLLSQVDFTQIDSSKTIHLVLNSQNTIDVETNGQATATITLPGVLNAKSLVLTTAATLPDGFTIDGQSFVDGKLTVTNVNSLTDLQLPVGWNIGSTPVYEFSVAVKFYDGLNVLDYGNAPLNFYHSLSLPTETLDSHSNTKLFLSSSGYSYDITGTSGSDIIRAGSGNDLITGGLSADTLDGGDGTDTASYAGSSAVNVSLIANAVNTGGDAAGDLLIGIENLIGSSNADVLTGNTGVNKLEGALGNDTLLGGAGADTLDGGDGTDTASYVGSSAVNVSLIANAVNTGGDAAGDLLIGIENLIGSSNADVLTGNTGVNKLEGALGNDTLLGGAGADTLDGGDGTDTASYVGSSAVNVSLIANAVNTGGDAAGDRLISIENLIGSSNADVLSGNSLDNQMQGGAGADTLDGGDGTDTASYVGSSAVNVSLIANAVNTGGDAAGDLLISIENLIGSSNDDTLTGNSSFNRLEGGDGNDRLIGGGGFDTLVGGAGNDTYVIGNTGVSIIDVSGNDTVESSIDFTLQTGLDNLTLSGTATKGFGNDSANIITGNGNNNELNGGGNDDVLVIQSSGLSSGSFNGGSGVDTLKISASSMATIDLTSIDNAKFLSIEKIDLTDTTGTNVLKLNFNAVKNLVDITSGTPTLSVKLGTGDTIDFVADTGQQVFNNTASKTMTIFAGAANALEQLAVINYA